MKRLKRWDLMLNAKVYLKNDIVIDFDYIEDEFDWKAFTEFLNDDSEFIYVGGAIVAKNQISHVKFI